MSECFTWLHLTDLHAGMDNQDWLWPDIRERFFKDLKKLLEKTGPVDVVLFTGDLTQKGSEEEFQKVDTILKELWVILKESGSEPKFLAVPGNHDLVRPADEDDPTLILLTQWNEQKKVRKSFWNKPDSPYRQIVNESFDNYKKWWNRLAIKPENIAEGMLPGDFSTSIKKRNAKIGIVGLNTSFLQLTQDNYEKKLALHPCQFHEICGDNGPDWIKQHHACLFLTHHPITWLNEESQQRVNEHIMAHGRFAVHLCGHMHETVYRSIEEAGVEARRVWQGRSLFGLEYFGEKEKREFGYNIGKIKLDENQGKLFFFPRQILLIGGQKEIESDTSIKLTDEQCTIPKEFNLHQSYININSDKLDNSIEIEFVNRMKERDYITDKYCPQYLLISAPMGYGKTRLLGVIEEELEKQGWLVIRISLSREEPVTIKNIFCMILKINETDKSDHDLILDVSRYVSDSKNTKFVLTIDHTEHMDNSIFQKICKFFEILQEELDAVNIKFRLILTRRYTSDWEIDTVNIPFREYYLSAFDYPAVLDTVNLYAKSDFCKKTKTSNDYRKIFASYLMYYTAGYPKAMVEILNEDFGRSKTLLEETEKENGGKYYEKNLAYVINDILEHIFPVDLRSVFLQLSPVRKFNARFIEFCIKENLIETDKNQFKLENLLVRTHLINRKEGFLQDHITRRLLAIHLYQTNPDNFINICEKAIIFYEERLKDPKTYSAHIIMIEFIFQKIQHQFYKGKVDKESLFKIIDEMLCNTIRLYDPIPFIENMAESIDNDNEFRFMFNYMMKQNGYDDQQPFNDLIQKIKKVKDDLKGERKNG